MFIVDGTTITLSRGDTGSVVIGATGYTFGTDDRAVFTMKNGAGVVIMENYYELEDGQFKVYFRNADTDSRPTGSYQWDVRYVINPYYDSNGRIVDGDQVITPNLPMTLTILDTVGEV